MKLNRFFIGLLAAGMFASCSDSVVENGHNSLFDENGDGYLKIAINLPSANGGSRAIGQYGDDYGMFNDGDKAEYTVENALVCIFSDENATSELDYKFIGAYDLGAGDWNKDTNTQITTNRTFIRKINNAGSTGNLYAYVVINRHNFFEIPENTHELKVNTGCDTHGTITLTGKTLKEFAALEIKEAGRRFDANSFLMTNMPYANVKGGQYNPTAQGATVEMHTLYPISTAIYPSQAEANNPSKPAAEINVERVLAKVETKLSDGVLETEYNHYKFKFLGWFIDNTNPNTYVGRHFNMPEAEGLGTPLGYLAYNNAQSNTYRMISEFPISASQQDRFRTFWAIDANYNVSAYKPGHDQLVTEGGQVVDNNLMKFDATGHNIGGRLRPTNSYYYCTENTFDVFHQSVSNTTRVIVAAQFLDGDNNPLSFYTIESEYDKMYDLAKITEYAKGRVASRASYGRWAQAYIKSGVDASQFITISVPTLTASAEGITLKVAQNPTGLTIDHLQDPTKLADAIAAYNSFIESTPEETGHNEFLSKLNINYFHQGVSYYHALIQHYGEYETPWSKEAHNGVTNTTTNIYDNLSENAYLGRYGVVRNNWYKLDVTGVRQIGSPVVPPVPGKDPDDPNTPDTPDDQVESYLKLKINITPWAIRKQTVIL